MCGIVAASAHRNVGEILISGLHTLEYRGYDSAGIALQHDGGLGIRRTKGKVRDLEALLEEQPLEGHCGIAHTRWATHGVPSTANAHPHVSHGSIALVHNGIIENHDDLRAELLAAGYEFSSETDTEVMVHLVHDLVRKGNDLFSRSAQSRFADQGCVCDYRGSCRRAGRDRRCTCGQSAGPRHRFPGTLPGFGCSSPAVRDQSFSSTWKKVMWSAWTPTVTKSVTGKTAALTGP